MENLQKTTMDLNDMRMSCHTLWSKCVFFSFTNLILIFVLMLLQTFLQKLSSATIRELSCSRILYKLSYKMLREFPCKDNKLLYLLFLWKKIEISLTNQLQKNHMFTSTSSRVLLQNALGKKATAPRLHSKGLGLKRIQIKLLWFHSQKRASANS